MNLTTEQPTRRALLAEAVAALEARSFEGTDTACASLLAADPEDMEALLLRGLALAAAGQTAPAARLLDHVAAARADYAHPCRDLGGMLGAVAFASQVRACLDLTPQDARLRLMWADCLHLGGDLEHAADALAAVLDDGPETAAAHHRLGTIRAELGEIDAAIGHMLRAVILDRRPALGWGNLGLLLKIQGRFDESLDAYAQALRRAPQDARLRVNRVWRCCRPGGSPRRGGTMRRGSRWASMSACRSPDCCPRSRRCPTWPGGPCC